MATSVYNERAHLDTVLHGHTLQPLRHGAAWRHDATTIIATHILTEPPWPVEEWCPQLLMAQEWSTTITMPPPGCLHCMAASPVTSCYDQNLFLNSCLTFVRFCVNRSRFFELSVSSTSFMSFSRHSDTNSCLPAGCAASSCA